MPRNSSGTMSAPAGQPAISGTTISSSTFNTLVGDLTAELTDSLSRSGKGSMLAPVRTPDGTVAAPAHSFTAETGSGWYRAAAGDLRLAIAGVDLLSFKNNVLTLMIAGNPIFQAGGANSALSIVGNKDAADTGTDTSISSSATRTAGDLLQIQNHGSLSLGGLGVDFHGLLRLGAQAAAIQPASLWTAITPNTGWTAGNGLAFSKDPCGFTHVRGSLTNNTGGAALTVLSTVPLSVGFRPSTGTRGFSCASNEDDGTGRARSYSLQVLANGQFVLLGTTGIANGVTLYLDGISFVAEQ